MCRYSLPGETDFQYPFGLTCARITHIGRTLLYGDERRVAGSGGDRRRQVHGKQGCTRVWRRVCEPWVSESPWAGALARAAECHVA